MGAIFRGRKCYTGKVKFTDYQNIGKIDAFMRTTAPKGYLACDGSTYNIADYPLLCDVFASDFGSVNYFGGDGTTTFKVPDLRGEFLRGTGANSHTNQGSGANVGTHQNSTEIPYMHFRPNVLAMSTDGNNNSLVNVDTSVGTSNGYNNALNSGSPYGSSTSMRGTIRPTNTSVLYCIRAY